MKKLTQILVFLILITLITTLTGCSAEPPATDFPVPTPSHQATSTPAFTPTSSPTIPPTIAPTLSPPPAEGAFGKITFNSDLDGDFEIYTMNLDGSNQIQLTDNEEWDCCAVRSPDGTKIVFATTRKGDWDIYVMNADGSDQTQLTSDPKVDTDPTWSPDGEKILFTSNRTGNPDIYVMNADGSHLTRLTNNRLDNSEPRWSPQGTKIVYLSVDLNNNPNEEIFVMNADGSDPVQLTNNEVQDLDPTWSPDGTKIAYVSTTSHGVDVINWNIYVMDDDGGNSVPLTSGTTHEWSPTWSPDGTMMAYTSCSEDSASATGQICNIFMMNADGSNQNPLTDLHYNTYVSDWSSGVEGEIGQSSECSAGWSRLKIGSFASVTDENNDPNRVRSGPNLADEVITQIYPGTPLKVIEGPICADGFVFWKVEHSSIPGGSGWTAEGDRNEYWLEPYTP